MTALRRLWKGNLPLAEAFWTWAVLGGALVNVATSGLSLGLAMADRPLLALAAGYLPSVPYNALVTVGVWRAAGRHPGDRRWADLARVATVAVMLPLTLT